MAVIRQVGMTVNINDSPQWTEKYPDSHFHGLINILNLVVWGGHKDEILQVFRNYH